jgi:hypothetical protein
MVASDGEADADRCVRVDCGIGGLWDARPPRKCGTRSFVMTTERGAATYRARDAEDRQGTPDPQHQLTACWPVFRAQYRLRTGPGISAGSLQEESYEQTIH